MCGRVRLSSDYSKIKIRLKFDLDAPAPNFEPDWNKPPTAPMLVAIRSVDGKRIPKMMKWVYCGVNVVLSGVPAKSVPLPFKLIRLSL
jgi:putative SOS response-associated peptidase YedK